MPLCGLVGRQFGRQQSSCRPTVVGAVGEQRLYAHHGALPPSYLSTVEKCSVVISLAPSEMTSLEGRQRRLMRDYRRRSMLVRFRR
jgi:hypothetical protein